MIENVLGSLLDSDLMKKLEDLKQNHFSKLDEKDRNIVNSKTKELSLLLANKDQKGLNDFIKNIEDASRNFNNRK